MSSNKTPVWQYVVRLGLIVLLTEIVIMLLFSWSDINQQLPEFAKAIIDSLLLLILSSYPAYRWVYQPVTNDIRKHSEETDMLASALQGAGESVVITDSNANIIYVNESFTTVTGYSQEEVLGKNPNILASGKQDTAFYRRMWNDLEQKGEWRGELWNKRKNGDLYPEALDIRSIRDNNGNLRFYIGIFSDLSEKKAIESALLQTQKLEAVGTLVGGVAHNFNNLLAAISGKAYLAERSNNEEKNRAYIREIQKLSRESAELVKQLLTFSRKTEHIKRHVDFIPWLKDAIETAKMGIPESITVKVFIPDQHGFVLMDPVHIKQAIINIVNNARDAVEDSEMKEILIVMRKIERRECKHSTYCGNLCEKVFQIRISDTGKGINTSDIERMFDPFFTTKAPGKGTGLGLSTARSVIREHDGAINVESTFSRGTTFTICLPVDETAEGSAKEASNEMVRSKSGELILVADDDGNVRDVTIQLLNDIGYRTIAASDASMPLNNF